MNCIGPMYYVLACNLCIVICECILRSTLGSLDMQDLIIINIKIRNIIIIKSAHIIRVKQGESKWITAEQKSILFFSCLFGGDTININIGLCKG